MVLCTWIAKQCQVTMTIKQWSLFCGTWKKIRLMTPADKDVPLSTVLCFMETAKSVLYLFKGPVYFKFVFPAAVETKAELLGIRLQWPPALLQPCSADLEHWSHVFMHTVKCISCCLCLNQFGPLNF